MKNFFVSLAVLCIASSVEGFTPEMIGPLMSKLAAGATDMCEHDGVPCDDRRAFFRGIGGLVGVSCWSVSCASLAQARGLVSFPCVSPLLNVYHIMRAGTSLLEEEDIWSTNPLFLTNRESALSQKGVEEVREACRLLQAADINPSVIKYSLAASAVDSATVVRDELKVGQNRMIPEFTFMDPRALGGWDMMSLKETYPAIVALDEAEAGSDGKGAQPPPNIDGTPPDTLADQAIRLRQLMSVLETQFSGDNIVLIFPDGSSPALLSAMIAGIPYNKVHVLDFSPGEIRLNVTMEPTLQLFEARVKSNVEDYGALIKSGKTQLERLRLIDDEDLVSKKDMLIEKERVEIEQEYRQREKTRLAEEERQRRSDSERTTIRASPKQILDGYTALPMLTLAGAVLAYANMQALRISGRLEPGGGKAESDTSSELTFVTNAQKNSVMMGMSSEPAKTLYSDLGTGSSSVYETPKQSEDARHAAAQQAMQTYLDQDDGGSAWLQAMADIIDEDEHDDPKSIDRTN
jgi:broad specificity phosphatase PhoE